MYKSFNPFLNAYIGHVHPYGHPRTFVWPTYGGDQDILRFLKGKLDRLAQGVCTIHIERIPIVM